MTKHLYMDDSYLKKFESKVQEVLEQNKLVLDQSCFYPRGGGVASDTGNIFSKGKKYAVTLVAKESGKTIHMVEPLYEGGPGDIVKGEIDWEKRYSLMRQHTAAHALSSVINSKTGALITGNNIDTGGSRIDFSLPEYDKELIQECVSETNKLLSEGREVKTYYLPREEAFKIPGLVKLAGKLPPAVKNLRIVEIVGVDTQADGGCHVKNTSEVGKIVVEKTENKGKDNRRIYFRLE